MIQFLDETIFIEALRVDAIIGIHPHERARAQPLVFTLRIDQDFELGAKQDQIGATVDYSACAEKIRRFVRESDFELLETLARRLTEHLLDEFAISRLTLEIRKPQAVAGSDGAGVSLTALRTESV